MAPPAPTPGNEKPEGPDLNTAPAVPPTVLGPEGTTPEEKDSMPTQHGLMKLVQNMEQLIPLPVVLTFEPWACVWRPKTWACGHDLSGEVETLVELRP